MLRSGYWRAAKGALLSLCASLVVYSLGVGTAAALSTTVTSLSSSSALPVFGEPLTLTAEVSSPDGVPGGEVTFVNSSNGMVLGIEPLDGVGKASLTVSTLYAGKSSLVAKYAGSEAFGPSESVPVLQTVALAPTTTAVTSSPNPSNYPELTTLTATVTTNAPSTALPDGGFVRFRYKTDYMNFQKDLFDAPVVRGVASGRVRFGPGGIYAIYAQYFAPAGFEASISAPHFHTVPQEIGSMFIEINPPTPKPGQLVTIRASVDTDVSTTNGTITIKSGNTILASGPPMASYINYQGTFPIGQHTISATYSGSLEVSACEGSASFAVDPRVGPEIKPVIAGAQETPAFSEYQNGHVAVWASPQGAGSNVYRQLLSPTFTKIGSTRRLNTAATVLNSSPAVTGVANGSEFVAVWEGNANDGKGYGILGQRYGATGEPRLTPFRIAKTTLADQRQPAVAALNPLIWDFVVLWASAGNIYGQLFDVNNRLVGPQFRANSVGAAVRKFPKATALDAGGFVATWLSVPRDTTLQPAIFAQKYDQKGRITRIEFQVSPNGTPPTSQPSIASLSDGGFVIAWVSGTHVYVQRFSALGARNGPMVKADTGPPTTKSEPAIAGMGAGFVVAWTSQGQDGSGTGVYGRVFNKLGNPIDNEFRLNSTTANNQKTPALIIDPNGEFMAVWTSLGTDGSSSLYGQRFKFYGVAGQ